MSPSKPIAPQLNRRLSITDGLLGAWPMWERGGAAHNSAVNRHHAALLSGAAWGAGERGILLDTSTAGAAVPNDVGLQPTQFSAAVLARHFTSGEQEGGQMIIDYGRESQALSWQIRLDGNSLQFIVVLVTANASSSISRNDFMPEGQWTLIVGTHQNTVNVFYTNGIQRDTDAGTGAIDYTGLTRDLTFGSQFNGSNAFAGEIAFGAYWDRVLSASEVLNLYRDPFAMFRARRRVVKAPGGIVVLRRRRECA